MFIQRAFIVLIFGMMLDPTLQDKPISKMETGTSITSSLEALMESYIDSRMGYNSYGSSDSSITTMLLCLALGLPLILTLLPLLLGPLMTLLGLTGVTGVTGVTGIPTVTPGVVTVGRRKREVAGMVSNREARDMPKIVMNVASAIYKYGSLDRECKKRAICEINREGLPKKAGNIAQSLLKFLRHSNVSSLVDKHLRLDEFVTAAKIGATKAKCNFFYRKCKDSTDSFLRSFSEIIY